MQSINNSHSQHNTERAVVSTTDSCPLWDACRFATFSSETAPGASGLVLPVRATEGGSLDPAAAHAARCAEIDQALRAEAFEAHDAAMQDSYAEMVADLEAARLWGAA